MRIIPYTDGKHTITFKTDNVYKDLENFFDKVTAMYEIIDTKLFRKEIEEFIFSIDISKINMDELSKQFINIIVRNCRKEKNA
jgi:hypothetical protein